MKQYHDFLRHILAYGNIKDDRTGTGTISAVVPPQMRFIMEDGFPQLTTKKLAFKPIKHELKWFTNGDTNIKYLLDNGVNIWNDDAYRWYRENKGILSKESFIERIKNEPLFAARWGDLGPIYGAQWRKLDTGNVVTQPDEEWPSKVYIDQLANVVEQITEVKNGNAKNARRLIVNAWNVGVIDDMALPPCHVMMQFFVHGDKLSLHLYQRSGDAFLGIPFNISSYSLLLHIIANQTGLTPWEFVHTVGDAHIYMNHLPQVYEQLQRKPKDLPHLALPEGMTIDNWEPERVRLWNYYPHPAIKGKLSV